MPLRPASETGRKTTQSNCPGRYTFEGLAPGAYEVSAVTQNGAESGFIDLCARTITGGVITALGRTMAGVMSNSDAIVAEIDRATKIAGEKIWRLPLGEPQREGAVYEV